MDKAKALGEATLEFMELWEPTFNLRFVERKRAVGIGFKMEVNKILQQQWLCTSGKNTGVGRWQDVPIEKEK